MKMYVLSCALHPGELSLVGPAPSGTPCNYSQYAHIHLVVHVFFESCTFKEESAALTGKLRSLGSFCGQSTAD